VIAVARYLLAEFIRTRRFAAPALVLVVLVVGLYASGPNPVLESSGSIAGYAFPLQAWLALTFLDSAGATHRQLLAATVGGRTLALGRLLGAVALALGATVLLLGYPIAAGRYERVPHPAELCWCAAATFASLLAGTALAALFAEPLVRSRATAVLGLVGCVVATIPLELPPSIPTARALDTRNVSTVPGRLAGDLLSIAAFALAAAVACCVLWQRAE
jgi:hypothetical protein